MEWTTIDEEGNIDFDEEVRLVPSVQAILTLNYNKQKGDIDGRKRQRAKDEAKYIRLMYSIKSPYADYSKTERQEEVFKACGFPDKWEESPELQAVIKDYLKAAPSKTRRLLAASENFLGKLEEYINDVDLKEKDKKGALVHDPKVVVSLIKELPSVAKTLQQLEQQLRTGYLMNEKATGDHEVGWSAVNKG